MMRVLVLVEHQNQILNPATLSAATAAGQLADNFDALVVGQNCSEVAENASHITGCQHVWLADHSGYAHQLAENSAKLIAYVAKDYDCVLAPATTYGKNVLPRVAALLDVPMLSDVVAINDAENFVCPMYAGNVLATMENKASKKVMTIRGSSFARQKTEGQGQVQPLDKVFENTQSQFVSFAGGQSERPDLNSARVVVSGGRGIKSADNYKLIENLADKLGAAVGATRAIVDAGFVPNDYQVGQTGKIVAPELYIAVGISGAIQHLAGIKDSKIIVAINQDEDAPIFQVADYGLVGDLFEIVPKLIELL